jgi:hypothetical protein
MIVSKKNLIYSKELLYYIGATTLSLTTFSKTTLSIMTLSITTLGIMTFSIMTLSIAINKWRHSAQQHSA